MHTGDRSKRVCRAVLCPVSSSVADMFGHRPEWNHATVSLIPSLFFSGQCLGRNSARWREPVSEDIGPSEAKDVHEESEVDVDCHRRGDLAYHHHHSYVLGLNFQHKSCGVETIWNISTTRWIYFSNYTTGCELQFTFVCKTKRIHFIIRLCAHIIPDMRHRSWSYWQVLRPKCESGLVKIRLVLNCDLR